MSYDLIEGAFNQITIGGWVMYPLIITCMWMWYLIIKKTMDMRFYTKGWRPVHECIKNAGKEGFTCAFWQQKLMEGYLAERTDDLETNEQLMDGLKANHELFVKQDVGTIAMLAGVAPLLGLLGTVSGMIKTFAVIAEFGTGNAKALAGGISEALLTTQTGLVVAVPGLFVATFLARRTNGMLERMQRFCLRVTRSDLSNN
ncbi:MAG: MotA/TolQ/ExbB proton channel family protein [Desulfobacteraceae bacterium]